MKIQISLAATRKTTYKNMAALDKAMKAQREAMVDEIAAAKNSVKYKRVESLADQLRKLKCTVTNAGSPLSPGLQVRASKYPFTWCMTKLGWKVDKVGYSDTANHYLVRDDGSFRLRLTWRGTNFLAPNGADWDTE